MFTFVQTHEQYKNAPNTHHWHWLICCLWNVCISQWETGGRSSCCHDNRHKLAIRRGRGKQASNKCQWVVDGDIYDVGRWTQFTTGNIHRYKPEKLFNWQIIKAFLLKCQYILRTVRILNLFSFIVRKMNLNAEEDTSDAEKKYNLQIFKAFLLKYFEKCLGGFCSALM